MRSRGEVEGRRALFEQCSHLQSLDHLRLHQMFRKYLVNSFNILQDLHMLTSGTTEDAQQVKHLPRKPEELFSL